MRFSPHTEEDKKQMLEAMGVKSMDELLKPIPKPLRASELNFPDGISELELRKALTQKTKKNNPSAQLVSFLGAGAYEHFVPQVVESIISRGEFLTAYTPYQAEASQGTLQAIYEYQSLICELTGMDVANASMYDGASALAEAALLAIRETERMRVIFSDSLHSEYRQVLKTYLEGYKVELVEIPNAGGTFDEYALKKRVGQDTACVIVQNPNFFGCIEKVEKIENICHAYGALLIACVNPISLGILKSPGEYNADIAVGEGQPLGIPLNYGGPYLGFFAVKEKHMRKMPGRIVGMTKDVEGKRGFVLTLQAREQHIRREKATSNICTNEGLMALAATVYLSLIGKEGIKEVAYQNVAKSHYLKDKIVKLKGCELLFDHPFFNEFVIRCKKAPDKINSALRKEGFIGGLNLGRFYPKMSDCMLICVTETKSKTDLDRFVNVLNKV